MNSFNIHKIIAHYGLDQEIGPLAEAIFQGHKYPRHAFMRILRDEGQLDATQIQRLADYLGVTPGELFSPSEWKAGVENSVLTFTKGEYKVKLAYQGVFLSLYKNNELLDQKIADVPAMTVREFLNYIDKLIKVN